MGKKDKEKKNKNKKPADEIIEAEITEELQDSYLDYAMSVIVSRALPDLRDGLKPVQRRIMWAMWDMNLKSDAKFVKSARVVGECFVEGTLVSTKNGLAPIEDIDKGDEVYTQSGLRKVTEIYGMPPREVVKVRLENGIENTVTKSQEFKVLKSDLTFEWKKAKDLDEDDYLVIRSVRPESQNNPSLESSNEDFPQSLSPSLAYTLGAFVSDGWISNDYSDSNLPRLGFSSGDREVLEKIKKIFAEEFNYVPSIETREYSLEESGVKNEIYSLRVNRKEINDFFVKNFEIENKNAYTKSIPRKILLSSDEAVYSFLSGLIDGDGSVHKNRNVINYSSISKELIQQLGTLLISLGFTPQIYKNHVNKQTPSLVNGREVIGKKDVYSLEITGEDAVSLSRLLTLESPRKRERSHKIVSNSDTSDNNKGRHNKFGVIPYANKIIFNELSNNHLGGGWYEDKNGNKFRQGIKYPSGSKIRYSSDLHENNLNKTQVLELGIKKKLKRIDSPLFDFIEEVIDKNLSFIKVESIEGLGEEKTFDIQVEKDHEFIANGVISHNCLGKYHPHGDSAVYDTMVRMAQDFSLRYPLVDGQGNFGNIDGDNAAAQRYTEARLAKISEEMLVDIEKDTVDWRANYDNTRDEPEYLPAKLPNLLLNGTMGIAVGMATNIPPHNLGEIINAVIHLARNPEASVSDLMEYVPAPDFPTGGIIYGRKSIEEAYATGKGSITIRAKTEIEETDGKGGEQIVIHEIPYQVVKSSLIEKVADLVKDKKIKGIKDIRDESDREGLRVVIELKQAQNPDRILNKLFKHTRLQKNFHFNMVALAEGIQPRVVSLKDILSAYIEHRKNVVERRTKHDLAKAEERAHILEGLVRALDEIDAVIETIKKSKDKSDAQKKLIKKFDLTEIQANAILEMRLQTLASLAAKKLKSELKEKKAIIKDLKAILDDPQEIINVIVEELEEIKENYADDRKTDLIAEDVGEFNQEDFIPKKETVILLTKDGYIKRVSPSAFRVQKRGGQGLIGFDLKEEDQVDELLVANTHNQVLFFTDQGKVYKTRGFEVPKATRTARGKLIHTFLGLSDDEKVTALVSYPKELEEKPDGKYLAMATKGGIIKKTSLKDFENIQSNGIIAINLNDDDLLGWVKMTDGEDEIIITTQKGQAIRFNEDQARAMGRTAKGVKAVDLKKKDKVTGFDVIRKGDDDKKKKLLVITEKGFGKQTTLDKYKSQKRGGVGLKTAKVSDKTGNVIASKIVDDEFSQVLAFSAKGKVIKTDLKDIQVSGRATKGVKVMKLGKGDSVVGIVCL